MTVSTSLAQCKAEIYRAALEQISVRADYIRQLPPYDMYRKSQQDAWADARSIAMRAFELADALDAA